MMQTGILVVNAGVVCKMDRILERWIQAIIENPDLATRLLIISLTLNLISLFFICLTSNITEGKLKSVCRQLRAKGITIFEWM